MFVAKIHIPFSVTFQVTYRNEEWYQRACIWSIFDQVCNTSSVFCLTQELEE